MRQGLIQPQAPLALRVQHLRSRHWATPATCTTEGLCLCAGLFGGGGFPARQLGIVLSACLATPTLDACSSVRPLGRGGTHMRKPPELCPCRQEHNVWIPLSREQRCLCPRTGPVRISSQLAPPRNHTGTNYFWMRSTWAMPQCQWLV